MRERTIDSFSDMSVLVVGDIMIDHYLYGETTRISPEAPVPVVKIVSENNILGGAANAANNLASLGSKVYVLGVVGDDSGAEVVRKLFKEKGISFIEFVDPNRPTIVKKRIITGNNYQVLRVDYEKTKDITSNVEKKILFEIQKHISEIDAIVISDYAKGTITRTLSEKIIKLANDNNKIITVDGKPEHVVYFKKCTLITPNLEEAIVMSGVSEDILEMGNVLTKKLGCCVYITRGSEGISVFDTIGRHTYIPSLKLTKICDVTGAGDTVIAAATLSLIGGMDLVESAKLSNFAAGLVVRKPGTATVTQKELKMAFGNEISSYFKESIEVKQKLIKQQSDKIEAAANYFIDAYKSGKKVIAFGNGGSAADAQHLVAELVGRYKLERVGLPAIALTTDSSILTAIANDYGYDKVFERQIEANATPGDVILGISTSGNSPNVLLAIEKAKSLNAITIGLTGNDGGKLNEICDLCIVVPSNNTPRIQESHIAIIHTLCELLEKEFFKDV